MLFEPGAHLIADFLAVDAMRIDGGAADAVVNFETRKYRFQKRGLSQHHDDQKLGGPGGVLGTESVLITMPLWAL